MTQLIICLIVTVNIKPFKKAAIRYSSTDQVFLSLLTICIAIDLGGSVTRNNSYCITVSLYFILLFFTLAYVITFFG